MGNLLPCLSHGANISPKPPDRSKLLRSRFLLDARLNACFQKRKKPTQIGGARRPVKESEKKGVTRLKVVLTKQEAARLLSMFSRGEERAATAVRRLERLQAHRRQLSGYRRWTPALSSIPED